MAAIETESDELTSAAPGAGDLWVLGYGSLMWRPGFQFAEARRARLVGYARAFCITSVHYRGTREQPGLVLGLDRGGTCEGVAFRVPAAEARTTLGYLRAREQVTGVYVERRVSLWLGGPDHGEVEAVTYVAERRHPAYAGHLSLAEQARIIRGARGRAGSNLDYLVNTLRHLRELGIREPRLERLGCLVGGLVLHDCPRGLLCARAEAMTRAWSAKRPRLMRLKPDQRRRFVHRLRLDAVG
ncbi:MAG: gamma-glutamylcyclotransferase [Pseudomonadota bacterium]